MPVPKVSPVTFEKVDCNQRLFARKTLDNNDRSTRWWRPAVFVKTRVRVGCSVSQAHQSRSRSFLFKDFPSCLQLVSIITQRLVDESNCSAFYLLISDGSFYCLLRKMTIMRGQNVTKIKCSEYLVTRNSQLPKE